MMLILKLLLQFVYSFETFIVGFLTMSWNPARVIRFAENLWISVCLPFMIKCFI